jgi:hypothetical protein
LAPSPLKPPRDAWAQWIGPETLIAQVRGTAPFLESRWPAAESGRLIELGDSPDGFLRVLANWENLLRAGLTPEEQLQDYFALCLACHHATVATLRAHRRRHQNPRHSSGANRAILEVVRPMLRLALSLAIPGRKRASRSRAVRGVSGHQRRTVERHRGWTRPPAGAGRLERPPHEALAAIESRDRSRAGGLRRGGCAEREAELDLLRLSMTLAHNRGDLTQGMGFWKRTPLVGAGDGASLRAGTASPLAVRVYQQTGLAADGHRHYPLRPVKALRRSPATLLPLCPFLDEWGGVVAQLEESHEVLAALVVGCQKVQWVSKATTAPLPACAPRRRARSNARSRACPTGRSGCCAAPNLRKLDRRAARSPSNP